MTYTDPHPLKMEKIVCRNWGNDPQVTFQATIATLESSVLIHIGDEANGIKALISREEIAAAAALWPVKR